MSDVRVLNAGVDALYFSVRGELPEGLHGKLAHLKEVAQAANEDQLVELAGRSFLARPSGLRGYPYSLKGAAFDVNLGAADPFPVAFLTLHADHMHAVGVEVACEDALRFSRDLLHGAVTPLVSRVDVYADVAGWEPQHSDLRRFVCRATTRKLFEVPREMYQRGRRLSGFTFGKGDVVARIYDKSSEVSSTGDTWPELFWKDRIEDEPVWRVEYQFRREVLASFGLHDPAEGIHWRQALWEYGTAWLSLRRRTKSVDTWRAADAPEWAAISQARIGLPREPLVRARVRAATEERLIRGWAGYTSSIAALKGTTDLRAALIEAVPAARRHLERRGTTFEAVATKKAARRRAME